MRRKSRTSCWSNPRRRVENVASATDAGDVGSGRENETAIGPKRRQSGAVVGWQSGNRRRSVDAARAASPPSRCSAASASSSVATGMISTSSAGHDAGPASDALALRGRHDEVRRRRPGATADAFWRRPPIAPTVAVEVDRPGDGDVLAAGELARRQLVDQGQRERQPGRRAADAAGVDVDLERQLDALRVEREEADDRALRFVRRRRSAHLDRAGGSPTSRSISSSTTSPGSLSASCGDEVVDGRQRVRRRPRRSVARIEQLVGGRVRRCTPSSLGDEAHHVADHHVARHDLRPRSRAAFKATYWATCSAVRIIWSESGRCWCGVKPELLLLGELDDLRLVAPTNHDRTVWAGSVTVTK